VPPARARLLTIYSPQAWFGAGQYFAPNPDFGAAIEYYLRAGAKDEAIVRVSDSRGVIVRTLKGSARTGLNRVSWDLRMESPVPEGGREPIAVAPGAPPQGPLALPGVYGVAVEVGGRVLKGDLRLESDPRVAFSEGDRRTRQAALLSLYELQKSLFAARAAAVAGVVHFDAIARTKADDRQPQERLRAVQTEISNQLTAINALSRSIEGYSGLPTADQRRQIEWAFDDAAGAVASLNDALQSDGERPARLMSIPKKP
jgi:hypothetical protein